MSPNSANYDTNFKLADNVDNSHQYGFILEAKHDLGTIDVPFLSKALVYSRNIQI